MTTEASAFENPATGFDFAVGFWTNAETCPRLDEGHFTLGVVSHLVAERTGYDIARATQIAYAAKAYAAMSNGNGVNANG